MEKRMDELEHKLNDFRAKFSPQPVSYFLKNTNSVFNRKKRKLQIIEINSN